MKEAIITDLNGLYQEPTLVAESATGVFTIQESKKYDEDEEISDVPDLIDVGYTVAFTVPQGLYKPKFDLKGYEEAQKNYQNKYEKYLAELSTYDEDSEEPKPIPPTQVNGSDYWVEGLTQHEIDEILKPPKLEPSPIELLQKDNASLLLQVAELDIANIQQSQDTAALVMKNAELETKNEQQSQDLASVLMQNAELEISNKQLATDYAALFIQLTEKGVI